MLDGKISTVRVTQILTCLTKCTVLSRSNKSQFRLVMMSFTTSSFNCCATPSKSATAASILIRLTS
ncbi:hypothetical protein OH492_12260 [Vibrio chagasii]|nr:hypothetical protein [Vibrio chagasii]